MEALGEALATLRAADELRRALPHGSRDRLALEADIAALDAEIHRVVTIDDDRESGRGVREVTHALRRRISELTGV